MSKKIIIFFIAIFMSGISFISCNTSDQKVEDARDKLQTSKDNTVLAKDDLNRAIKDSIADYQRFKQESELRISDYDQKIADLKVKIADGKKDAKSDYKKMVADLEIKTAELKKNLKEFKADSKVKWELFKTKFNQNMDDLGLAISNFFSSEKSVDIRN